MFIAALFIIVKKWKQPKCPSTDVWRSKICLFSNNVTLFSNKKELSMIHATTLLNLENMLNERSQSQNTTYCIILFI